MTYLHPMPENILPNMCKRTSLFNDKKFYSTAHQHDDHIAAALRPYVVDPLRRLKVEKTSITKTPNFVCLAVISGSHLKLVTIQKSFRKRAFSGFFKAISLNLRTFTAKENSKNPLEHGKFTGKLIKAENSH
jgi:hypothetical protein